MSVERQAVSGLKWSAASKFVAQGVAWSVTLVVMRLLAPADYGLMAMATVVISLATTIAELGLGASIVQAPTLPAKQLARTAGVVVMLNLAVGLLLVCAAPLVAWGFAEPRLTPIVQSMSLLFVFGAISSVPYALLSRDLLFKRAAAIDMAGGLASSVSTLALALAGHGVWALALGHLAGAALRAALLLMFAPRIRPSFRLSGASAHLKYGSAMTLNRVSWDLILQTDIMIASRHLSAAAIGSYSVGLHLATLPMQKIMSVVNQVAFAAMSRLQETPDRLRSGLVKAFRLATLVSVPLLWGLSSCAPEFIRVVLGPKWEDAILPVQVMSLVIPLRILSGLMWTAVSAVGHMAVLLRVMAIAAVVFPTSFLIGVQWGLAGLALAWPVAWLLNFGLGLRRTIAPIGLTISDIVMATRVPLLAGVPMAGAIALVRLWTPALDDAIRLPLLIAVGALSYLLVVSVLDRTLWIELRNTFRAVRQ